ncbi:GGDEF domain-containing protein [Mesorhizobium atlanticum]
MALADLDHFKALNDQHGHEAGDRVIADFAAKLRSATGARGAAGRIGGEEFAVLLPLSDLASARLFAEAIRAFYSRRHDRRPRAAGTRSPRASASPPAPARKG